MSLKRFVYVVMNARSAPYASICLQSLLNCSLDALSVTLLGDGAEDEVHLRDFAGSLQSNVEHSIQVSPKRELDEMASGLAARYPALMAFRNGHPCWRKITDPLLASLRRGGEVIVLDPDVLFPNPFRFVATPSCGVLLMWQRPNCLHPPEIVDRAFDSEIALADHTDIGVCQYMTQDLSLGVLEEVVASLAEGGLPNSAHVESIVWAAVGMRLGGGYLDPQTWKCWDHGLARRLLLKCGMPGGKLLALENREKLKCLHLGGKVKHWLTREFLPAESSATQDASEDDRVVPFAPYTRKRFLRKMRFRKAFAAMGGYKLLGQN